MVEQHSIEVIREGDKERRIPTLLGAVKTALTLKDRSLPVYPSLDLDKFMGTWYEIARLPVPFELKVCNVKAFYEMNPNGSISVLNRGRKKDIQGKKKYVTATATIPDANEPAKLLIQYSKAPLKKNDYWILDVSPDYQHALIGEPKKRFLWILTRSLSNADAWFDHCLKFAESLGYDTTRIIRTRHDTLRFK